MKKDFLNKTFPAITYLTLFFILSGCSQITHFEHNVKYTNKTAGYSVKGKFIEYSVFGNGKNTTFIIGAIHGHEPASAVLANELQNYLLKNPEITKNKTVIVLPVANPDGLKANSRYNANGVDLNRNFQAKNRQNNLKYGTHALSEPESDAIFKIISKYRPDKIVSIHQPVKCIDYDGPGLPLAQAMAAVCDLPVKKLGAMPGSLGSYVGLTLGKSIITLELSKSDTHLDGQSLWQKYGQALITAVEF
jgi:protein MpaA